MHSDKCQDENSAVIQNFPLWLGQPFYNLAATEKQKIRKQRGEKFGKNRKLMTNYVATSQN
jgi:hypothetical protein